MDEPDVEVVAEDGPTLVADVTRLQDDVRRTRDVTGLSEARWRALERAAAGPAGLLAVTARASGG